MIIDLPRFVAAERPSWTELETILHRIEREPKYALGMEEALRLHFLYQKASADLNRVTTFASEPQLIRYLEALVARAYGEIHEIREKKRPSWRIIVHFVKEFSRVFDRQAWAFWLAIAVTIAGVIFGGFAVMLDNDAKLAIVPAQFSHLNGSPAERVANEEAEKSDRIGGAHSTFAAALMTNNTRVSINAMAFGMSWGIGTLLVLFYNGVILGLTAVDYIMAGQTVFLLAWLLPHGSIELPSIFIGGQAGFVLAKAVIGRGDRKPLAGRLRAVGYDVAVLIGGVAVLLVWAGIIESFLSQHHKHVLPYSLKIAFGSVELAALIWYLWPGRFAEPANSEEKKS